MPHHVRPLAVLVALAAAAVAAVDVEIDPNAKTQGSLAAPGEVDTYRFFATAGADLSIALKAAKKTDLDLAAMLEGPGAVPVDLEGARKVKDTGKKLLVKGLTLPSTGTYTLTVGGGEGVGDYALRLRAKARRKIVETYSLGPGEEAFVEVPAPRGSSLRIKAKGGDGAVPRIGEDPPKAPGDSLRDDDVTGGDLTYRVVNDGDSGTVQVKVTVKAPKVPLDRVDVRSGSLGEPDGGETAISATVSAADGGAVTVGDVVSPLFGAGVDIAPGGLLSDTRITVASSSTIPVHVPEAQRAAGPAMEFGPDGLEVQVEAEDRLPFDPSAVPPGTDPDDVVRVVRQSSDGSQEIIVPSGVDMDDGLVTAPTSGFSRFMVFVPRGVPDLRDRGYWEIAYRLHHKPDDSGARDSRRRDLSVGIGALELSSFGDYFREFVTFSTGFEHDENGVGMVFPSTPFPEFETGTWSYDPSGQAVILFAGGGPGGGFGKGLLGAEQQQGYDLSVDGRVLVGFNRGNPDPSVELDLLVRRSRSPQSVASLAGTYTLAGLAIDAHETQSGGPLFLARSHEQGAMTNGAGGAVSAAVAVVPE